MYTYLYSYVLRVFYTLSLLVEYNHSFGLFSYHSKQWEGLYTAIKGVVWISTVLHPTCGLVCWGWSGRGLGWQAHLTHGLIFGRQVWGKTGLKGDRFEGLSIGVGGEALTRNGTPTYSKFCLVLIMQSIVCLTTSCDSSIMWYRLLLLLLLILLLLLLA